MILEKRKIGKKMKHMTEWTLMILRKGKMEKKMKHMAEWTPR